MALSIGDINFSVDADTRGLQKAVAKMQQFRQEVDKVARSQQKGGQQAANAMSRQESAMKKALQQVANLRQEFSKLEDSTRKRDALRNLSASFKRLTTEMTKGRLTTVQFQRSLDAFNTSASRTRRSLKDLKAEEARRNMSRLTEIVRDLESASVLAVGPLSGLGARIRAIGAITSRSSLALAAFFGVVTGGIVAVVSLGRAAVNATRIFEQAEARFLAASGSLEQSREEMSFVIGVSRQLGLRIQETARSYSRLIAATRGTNLAGENTRAIFVGVAKAAAALRLSNIEVEGTFRAIEQIISKGTVQAEELRGQLGERLPGAFRIAADSMGVTTQALGDMLKTGQVTSEEFLQNFIPALQEAFGDRAKSNVDSFQGSLNNLANAAILFARKFDMLLGITDAVKAAIQGLTAAIDFLRENMVVMIKVTAALAGAFLGLAAPSIIRGVTFLGGIMLKAAKATIAWTKAVVALRTAMIALPGGKLLAIIGRIAAAGLGAAAAWFGMSAALGDTSKAIEEAEDALNATMIGGAAGARELSEAMEDLQEEISETAEEIYVLKRATEAALTTGAEPKRLLIAFQSLQEVMKLTTPELWDLSDALEKALGRNVGYSRADVAAALTDLRWNAIEAKEAFDALSESAGNKATNSLQKAVETLEELTLNVQALRKGAAAAEVFDQVGKAALDFQRVLAETTLTEQEQAEVLQKYISLLREKMQLETQYAAEQRAQQKAEREAIKLAKDRAKAVNDVSDEMELMQMRLKAIFKGPDALEQFEQVTLPVEKLRQEFEALGLVGPQIEAFLERYRKLLQQTKDAEDLVSGAARQMANAVVNSLEDIILKTASVEEALRNLARELLRVFLRSQLLDPLLSGLTGGFSSFVTKTIQGGGLLGGGAGGGGGGSIDPRNTSGFATGGSFQVGGTGGMERPVGFFAKPGEEVTIRRPDQPGSGGAPQIIINAPGADAGTVARIKEIIRVEMVPQIVKSSTQNTLRTINRPSFA